ncbi:MAG: ATP-binding protein [Rhizobiales bacterium]|nr:ATP-binding protein [Hyphomicrobiales bacterium]
MKQRSLGFRWFFCFFLFTIYRAKKERSIIYLFDEPASNLHPKAQAKLLESLTKISETGAIIIYSTHSHHLIKPEWLEGAFVIRNQSADYELAADVRPESTDIQILPYKQFLEKDAGKTTYFQPIMDALDYRPSEIEKVNLAVLVEGKRDFYYLKYFKDVVFEDAQDIDFIPGGGAGTLGPLISLYQGWGKDFIILLDGDSAGRKERKNYNEKHFVSLDNIFTLEDINGEFKGIAAEKLFDFKDVADLLEEDVKVIEANIGKHKKTLTFKIQELLAGAKRYDFSKNTKNNFKRVLDFCYNELQPEDKK